MLDAEIGFVYCNYFCHKRKLIL